ncbi:Hypothetical protein PACV_419 [Pacmanvirus A23]|uniref:Hypothetical protein n=1 Tax=Pacmanvirus A23 TaxID=1932881 RepID=UPI000A095DAC|nr:Hypothetical protein B9W72_gp415 [Pacmanvirus A23]SIP86132.1 Hypothetical protein PACV_419 [Pacmanvirus A23]
MEIVDNIATDEHELEVVQQTELTESPEVVVEATSTTEVTEQVDFDPDEYMRRFDSVEKSVMDMAVAINKLDKQPHDQARVEVLIGCLKQQQKHNAELYDLLVEMNNCFGR